MGDFLDLVIDPDGRPWAAFVDVCNPASCTSNAGWGAGLVGTLADGPKLRGAAGPPVPARLNRYAARGATATAYVVGPQR